MKIKVGIFFGGPSKERELSFIGGRTVYDYLNRTIFEPVPIFVDSNRQWIVLDAPHLYSNSIRNFYPPTDELPGSPNHFQIYLESLGDLSPEEQLAIHKKVGRPILPEDLTQEIDVAFPVLFGTYGADGELQSLLESLKIPYTGSGVRASEVGIDKALQKALLKEQGVAVAPYLVINRREWLRSDTSVLFEKVKETVGFPARMFPTRQATAEQAARLDPEITLANFRITLDGIFSRLMLPAGEWLAKPQVEKINYIRKITAVDAGFGFPLEVSVEREKATLYHPEQLLEYLNQKCKQQPDCQFLLEGSSPEESVLIESIPAGQPFSCAVIQEEISSALALVPVTEQPSARGGIHQVPLEASNVPVAAIRSACEQLFLGLGLEVYARIDGYSQADGRIVFSTIRTSAEWHPTGFDYQQVAHVGLSPSQWMSLFVRASLLSQTQKHPANAAYKTLLESLDTQIANWNTHLGNRKKIAVLMGGYTPDQSLSTTSGRHVFNLLSSSAQFLPIPIFLSDKENQHELYPLPLPLLFSPGPGDLRTELPGWRPQVLEDSRYAVLFKDFPPVIPVAGKAFTYDDLKKQVDAVFIAIPDRPGEDGQVQMQLEARKIPYNGSGVKTTSLIFDRQRTLQKLKLNGLIVPEPLLSPNGQFDATEIARGAYHFLEIKGGLLTFARRDGSIAYEIFNPAGRSEWSGQWSAPAQFDKRGGSDQAYIEGQVTADLEKAAKVLQLEGCSTIDAYAKVFPSGKTETLITNVRTLPPLHPDAPLFQQAALRNYHPQDLIAHVLSFALARSPRPVSLEATETTAAEIMSTPITKLEPEQTPAYEPEVVTKTNTYSYMEETNQEPITGNEHLGQPPYYETEAIDDPYRPQDKEAILTTIRNRLKGMVFAVWGFLKTPAFLKNFGALIGLLLLIFILFTLWLRSYTNHGESLQVHNYVGLSLQEAKDKAESRSFSIMVIDSFFDPDEVPYRIYNQDPKPLSRVKEDRTIYLSIYSSTPKRKRLPTLVGNYDYSQYAKKLKHLKIKTKIKEQVFDSRMEPNTIMYLLYEGKKITDSDLRKGIDIPEGSLIEFVVTKNQADVVPIPDLVCNKYKAATFLISSLNLSLGKVYGEVFDREQAYVWKQEPEFRPGSMIRVGQQVNIYLTESRPSECFGAEDQ